ncbi:hypothetical protein NEOC65_002487 [Neochlamydia sp. AcF65]|nr:hypothetical protein [Neochlamydia sp. AcF65]
MLRLNKNPKKIYAKMGRTSSINLRNLRKSLQHAGFFCFLGLHMLFIGHKILQITNLKAYPRIILKMLKAPYQKSCYCETW